MTVIETSDLDDIKGIINNVDVVVLDIGAESWCIPCRRLRPHFDAASEKVEATLVRADIDENPSLPHEFDIMGVPTLLAFKAGVMVGYVEARTVVGLVQEINNL